MARIKKEIVINYTPREVRIAILENEELVEFLIEREDSRRTVGDIYLGRVSAVIPGIQAAFVDIGLSRTAFLHASDMLQSMIDFEAFEASITPQTRLFYLCNPHNPVGRIFTRDELMVRWQELRRMTSDEERLTNDD